VEAAGETEGAQTLEAEADPIEEQIPKYDRENQDNAFGDGFVFLSKSVLCGVCYHDDNEKSAIPIVDV
jgi:hypothetical protein